MAATKTSWERLLGLGCLLAITWGGWDAAAAYPVRLLVTLLHELGHAIGAFATGGAFERVIVGANGAVRAATRGGWPAARAATGYLGSMGFGAALLALAARPRAGRAAAFALGLALAGLASLYGRQSGTFWYALACGGLLASSGWWLPEAALDLMLRYLGCASCLYALFDLRSLQLAGHGIDGDAAALSDRFRALPPRAWAALWSVLAVVWVVRSLQLSSSKA